MSTYLQKINIGVVGVVVSLIALQSWAISAPFCQQQGIGVADQPPGESKDDEPAETDGPEIDTATLRQPAEKLSDQYVRFHMWDGTIVGGEIHVDEITMTTEFGELKVPIAQIRRLRPGLDSFPALKSKIEGLVEGLGDKDFDVREKSHRALSAMGLQIRNEIERFQDHGSAERKKRLAEIKLEIEESIDDMDELNSPLDQALIRGDTIETPEFTIVGKIQQNQFTVESKFGQLIVPLGDIRMGDRAFQEQQDSIRKTVDIAAEAFFQRTPANTRIRVNRGDRISVKATGTVQWTNWNTTSSPDGLGNQGNYQGIQSGTLCARVGSSGTIVKIGSKGEFVAKTNGVLYLGIAIQDNYVNNQGYRWGGNYQAKVDVTPSGTE